MLNAHGDTIIEVLLAITVFSMLSIGTMTIMNQGANTAQRALEITHVRQQIDGQVEALRAVQQLASRGDRTIWNTVIAGGDVAHFSNDSPNCPTGTTGTVPLPTGSFIMNPRSLSTPAAAVVGGTWYQSPGSETDAPYAHMKYDGSVQSYGMWIERTEQLGQNGISNAYTFVVNACWDAVGVNRPQRLETVVRLYDPGT